MNSLETLAKTTGKSVTDIMEPHKEVLQDMIPPKKHLLRHQPANAQIGLMVSFCGGMWGVLGPRFFRQKSWGPWECWIIGRILHSVHNYRIMNMCNAYHSILEFLLQNQLKLMLIKFFLQHPFEYNDNIYKRLHLCTTIVTIAFLHSVSCWLFVYTVPYFCIL